MIVITLIPLVLVGAGIAWRSQRQLLPMTYLPNYPSNARLHLSTMERTHGVPEDRC